VSQHRKHRGYESQRIVAQFLRDNGWPYAEPTGAGRPGSDVTGVPCVDVEVKARRNLDLTGTLQQQRDRVSEGVIPVAVIRPDGFGPHRIAQWPALVSLDVLIRLLHDAGYGDPNP
jgi:hypothetical protein